MTLIELLVALTIFMFLGGALVLFLQVGVDTWRVAEVRREAYERAQAILDQLADDLGCTFSDPSHGIGEKVDVIFLSDFDRAGRQRLRLVRTLAGEMRHPITQRAGALTSGRMDYDYENDALESELGFLRAPGGLQEVAYVLDPHRRHEMLWRGVRSPIGGGNSLFDDANLYEVSFGGAAAQQPGGDEPARRLRRCRPFADGVLYLAFNFWGPETTTWSDEFGGRSVALPYWDSTREILLPEDGYDHFYVAGSRHEDRDDIFPSRVQIVLVLRSARATRFGRLTAPVTKKATQIAVDTTRHYPEGAFQYIRIDDEWIRYESKGPRSFRNVTRGVRDSEAAGHKGGAPVIYGRTFSRVVRVPSARDSRWKMK